MFVENISQSCEVSHETQSNTGNAQTKYKISMGDAVKIKQKSKGNCGKLRAGNVQYL